MPVTITPIDAEAALLDVGGVAYRPFPRGGFDIAHRLSDMDAAGVDVHVLSATPQTYLYNQEAALGVAAAIIQNDQIAKHIAAHPGPLHGNRHAADAGARAAADELKRAISKLGLHGAMIGSNVMGKNLDDPSFEPLWATAEELDAFMFVHPDNVAGADRLRSYYLRNLIGNPLDTTIAAACLYFGGVLDRHPKLKVMLAHGGGFTPYQAARWEHGWRVRPEPKKNIKTGAAGHRQALLLRHHPAFGAGAGIHDRPCRRRPRAARQRLPLRHGHARLRAACAGLEHFRRRQGGDPHRNAETPAAGESVVTAVATWNRPRRGSAVRSLIADAMVKSGLPEADAAKVAELMLEADLTGADAHGVFRLPQYVHRLKIGGHQSAPQHQGRAHRAGDRSGRRRQRHGPSGGGARGRNRDRARARMRRRLGRHAHVEPRRRRRRLCRAAA